MKIIFALLLSTIVVNTVFAKASFPYEVSEKVVRAFEEKYPSVKAREWNFKNNIYSVKFIVDNKRCTANFDTAGQWKSTVTAIGSTKKLPWVLRNAFFKSHFSTWYVETIKRYELPETTFYEFLVDNGNLLDGDHHDAFLEKYMLKFSTGGTLISKTLL